MDLPSSGEGFEGEPDPAFSEGEADATHQSRPTRTTQGVAGAGALMIVAALLGLLLHSLNFVISMFSPSIHAVRLNFLEFFGKFFEAGNTEYSPFRKTGGEGQA